MAEKTPDYLSYQQSIATEFKSLKDRFRDLVYQWPTDGGWKESLLRSVLRRYLPESYIVGQGFIVNKSESSSQIDILIVAKDHPTLFKEDDLLIVTPDAVRAIIEVKTNLTGDSAISEATDKLTANAKLCKGNTTDYVWTGLFVYEGGNSETAKNLLKAISKSKAKNNVEINGSCFGSDLFMRGWKDGVHILNKAIWKTYNLKDLAPSYFIGNLIGHLKGFDKHGSNHVWFSIPEGKEYHATYKIEEGKDECEIIN